ncbi:MAG TPA: hypothetical protein PL005_15810, partial [Candidatus Hydrogenedentes bacterium]|nr:hypothetical protein [Candidatus Hydrogenedentota bacterium]
MRVVYTQDGGVAHDITRLVTSATWAGDYKQAARTLDIQVLAGNRAGAGGIITGRIGLGEMLQLFKGSAELFRGYVFSVEKGLSSSARTIHAYDGLVYALKSKIAQNFTAMTAKDITRQVAAGLGFPVGSMPSDAGLALSFAHIGKPAYEAIMGAWTKVSRATGYKYILRMDKGKLNVAIIGKEYAPFILSPASTVVDGSVSDSLEDAITQAVVISDKGAALASEIDPAGRVKYGILQAVESSKDKMAPSVQAKKLLKGPQQEISFSQIIGVRGAERLIAGNAAAVNDPVLGVFGRYFILNDSHTFSDGRHMVDVGLSLDALMDEEEIEEVK